MTFLKETQYMMERHDLSPFDIVFIGSVDTGHSMTWEEFEVLSDETYDTGYGAQKVASDLVIVFKDNSWLERLEYDGSEWWGFRKCPVVPHSSMRHKTHGVFVSPDQVGWQPLSECSDEQKWADEISYQLFGDTPMSRKELMVDEIQAEFDADDTKKKYRDGILRQIVLDEIGIFGYCNLTKYRK
jgi:hypothetical protein